MRGHLQCRDTLAGNEGCPLKTGTTVLVILSLGNIVFYGNCSMKVAGMIVWKNYMLIMQISRHAWGSMLLHSIARIV